MNDQFDELDKGLAQSVTRRRAFKKFRVGFAGAVVASTVVNLIGTTFTQAATRTVLNTLDKGDGSLRTTINNAKSGDTIVFAPAIAGGTITLTSGQLSLNKDLTIEGPGAERLAVSGNDNNRVFDIAEKATVTITGLTITHGFARSGNGAGGDRGGGGGGGILNAGNLTLANAVLSLNVGVNHGGGIANAPFARLTTVNCAFIGNEARSRDPSAITEGGAVYNSNRENFTTIIASRFLNNRAFGGDDGNFDGVTSLVLVGQCNGGAIHNGLTSVLTVENSSFVGNQAFGGHRCRAIDASFGNAGTAIGGAIANDENCDAGALVVRGCTFEHNQAIGGDDNVGSSTGRGFVGLGSGGAIYQGGVATVTDCTFLGNEGVGGARNTGGPNVVALGTGFAGAIICASGFGCGKELVLSGCEFAGNRAVGGRRNSGGILPNAGVGGALLNLTEATATDSTWAGNQALGGEGANGGSGGTALGGAVVNVTGATFTASDCFLSGNEAVGGNGGVGGNGANGFGGGVYCGGLAAFNGADAGPAVLALHRSTLTLNQAQGGAAGFGGAGGLGIGGGSYLVPDATACRDSATMIVGNAASTSDNDVFGTFATCP